MILVDANLLVYAHSDASPFHQQAHEWLDRQLNGHSPVGFPWASLLAFLRLVTNARVLSPPETAAKAWELVKDWLQCEVAWVPQPTARHAEVLGAFLSQPWMHGNLVPDAHLAALAIEHGLILCSADADFGRFPGLRWLNPLSNEHRARERR